MEQFAGRVAVVTGGGSGMGRELSVQLAAEGCHVALCDLSEASAAETRELCLQAAPTGTRVSAHRCDVADEAQVNRFRDEVCAQHETDHVNLGVVGEAREPARLLLLDAEDGGRDACRNVRRARQLQ